MFMIQILIMMIENQKRVILSWIKCIQTAIKDCCHGHLTTTIFSELGRAWRTRIEASYCTIKSHHDIQSTVSGVLRQISFCLPCGAASLQYWSIPSDPTSATPGSSGKVSEPAMSSKPVERQHLFHRNDLGCRQRGVIALCRWNGAHRPSFTSSLCNEV